MNREYKFLLLNSAMEPVRDMSLICLSDADALLIAEGMTRRNHVQVWDDRRLVGFVRSTDPETTEVPARAEARPGLWSRAAAALEPNLVRAGG